MSFIDIVAHDRLWRKSLAHIRSRNSRICRRSHLNPVEALFGSRTRTMSFTRPFCFNQLITGSINPCNAEEKRDTCVSFLPRLYYNLTLTRKLYFAKRQVTCKSERNFATSPVAHLSKLAKRHGILLVSSPLAFPLPSLHLSHVSNLTKRQGSPFAKSPDLINL